MQTAIRKSSIFSLLLALVLTLGMLPLTAFAATTYEVWFETDTNRGIRRMTLEEGEKIPFVSAGSKSGYVFDGWYSDESFTDEWNFDKDVVTKNTTLYARWISRDSAYTSNPYRRSGSDYYDSDYSRNYRNDAYYGYYGYEYGDPYFYGDFPVYREEIEVGGAKDQVYTGVESIKFSAYNVNKSSLMAVIVYPDGDREKEMVLEKGVDYTLARTGVQITLTDAFLQSLDNANYDVRIYFPNNQGNARFTVKN